MSGGDLKLLIPLWACGWSKSNCLPAGVTLSTAHCAKDSRKNTLPLYGITHKNNPLGSRNTMPPVF
jgi:hypothetical protein